MLPPRSWARISTSSTRSLVGSASSSLTISSAGPVPMTRASSGKRANASRRVGGPPVASALTACVNERPAEIDARRSRRPSGHAASTARIRTVRRWPKYARGTSASATAGTSATNTEPVSAVSTTSATQPAPNDADTNCRGVNPTPACCNHTRVRSTLPSRATRRRGRRSGSRPPSAAASSAQNVPMHSAASNFTTPPPSCPRPRHAAASRRGAPGRCVVRARPAARPSIPTAGRAPCGRRSARRCGRRRASARLR